MRVREVLSILLLLLRSSLEEDTVAKDLGAHQLERLVELLTSQECEDLLSALSHPEEDIFQKLDHLSLENNQLDLQARVRRDTGTEPDKEAPCRTSLTEWLQKHGKQTYYDRLARALQQIGRTDIAIEVGKNINQDKSLNMKRYVEDYHKRVNNLELPMVQTEDHPHVDQQAHARQVRDLRWSDLELLVERASVPPYQRRPLQGAWPLVYGLLAGFGGAFLISVPLLLFLLRISRGDLLSLSCSRGRSSSQRRHRQPSQRLWTREAGSCGDGS
ncbi:transmembrane and death domain protein 1-like [Hypomesus transpacificus]|uniref:transmembrane and death domain protein 1-like n=1 Tax=Hypomesus transpacificus TaxID=137520 RepID=UPI001F085C65|nr:transmembrane and death domain protein 1-like [Hypomesus transpacificus]